MDIGSFEQNWPSNTISIANESLGDIQIKTGANDASSPAAMGMVINLASPVGSDQYHGSLLYLIGPASSMRTMCLVAMAAASASQQPDFSFGGPIKRQRAWFFVSGRYIHRDDGISQTSTQDSYLQQIDPGFRPFPNEFPRICFSRQQLGATDRAPQADGHCAIRQPQTERQLPVVHDEYRDEANTAEAHTGCA